MGLRINQNIAAMNSYRNLSVTDGQLSKSLEKLSSGFRINRAADDAAGLAISEGLRSQIGGLKVASRNAQDGISVVQTAEGALNESHSILQRMRDLSVQAANSGSLNVAAQNNIQTEVVQLNSELNRIADTTKFNGNKLLDGTYTGTFQVGANAGESINVSLAGPGLGATGLGVAGVNVAAVAANAVSATVVNAVGTTPGTATITGDYSAAGATAPANFDALNGTVTVANKSLDLDSVVYATTDTGAQRLVKLQAALDGTFGSGAVTASVTGTASITFTGSAAPASPTAAQVAAVSVGFQRATGASAAITAIDTAISTISNARADLGAIQNRFEHTINNVNVTVENLSASESRIRDTDMAQEMVAFTRSQILSQAGTAMLAQANQGSQGVLQLLRG